MALRFVFGGVPVVISADPESLIFSSGDVHGGCAVTDAPELHAALSADVNGELACVRLSDPSKDGLNARAYLHLQGPELRFGAGGQDALITLDADNRDLIAEAVRIVAQQQLGHWHQQSD